MARQSAAQSKVPRRFVTGSARLGQYDRIDPDSPTFIRTTERKPGCGQALVKAVTKPARNKKPRTGKAKLDSRILYLAATQKFLLKELDTENRPTQRDRIKAEIKRLHRTVSAMLTEAGYPAKVEPDHKVRTANKLRAAEAAKDHISGIPAWER